MTLVYYDAAYAPAQAGLAFHDIYEQNPDLPRLHTVIGTHCTIDMEVIEVRDGSTVAAVNMFAEARGVFNALPAIELEDRHTFHCSECDGTRRIYGVRFTFDRVAFHVWGHLRREEISGVKAA